MRKGKMIAQGAHASQGAINYARGMHLHYVVNAWEKEGATKIVVGVDSLGELVALREKALKANLPVYMVTDAGKTEFTEATITALGIGPADDEKVDEITRELVLL